MKIKRKVEMTQEEYAKYMIDKYGVSGFESSLIDDNIIDAPKRFTLAFELNPVPKSDLLNGSFRNGKFTIEVEEEIAEDTRLDKLVVRYRNDDIYIFPQQRIKDFKNDSNIVALYTLNDDLTMTLICRDGKLLKE
jgi:hypothetical protein